MYSSMVRGWGIARTHVRGAIMKFCGIRSSLVGRSVGKGEDSWLGWHGIRCSWLASNIKHSTCYLLSLHRSVLPGPVDHGNETNLGIPQESGLNAIRLRQVIIYTVCYKSASGE